MEGFDYELHEGNPRIVTNLDDNNQRLGLIPRALRYLFSQIQAKSHNRTFAVSMSYIQIYNEKIYDLLDFENRDKLSNGLKLRWNKYDQFTVEGLEQVNCRSTNDALSYYIRGARNKVMAKHKMNVSSSRSHTILTVRVQSYDPEDPHNILSSRLELVDLAGSEKQSITGSVGRVFREGIEINKSLFTLRQVIASLFQYNKGGPEVHVPYRDSKLTSILKQSIGGNNYCVMIACINYGDPYIDESIQTLTYASMASYIANVPTRNEDPNIQEIKKLRQQLAEVTEQLNRANEHIRLLSDLANKRIQANNNNSNSNGFEGLQGPLKATTSHSQRQAASFHHGENSSQLNATGNENRLTTQTPKVKPSLSSSMKPKQFIESINMIKELLQSNIVLRENVENLNKSIQKKDSEMYQVMRENQILRERWEMVGGVIIEQEEAAQRAPERHNITEYEKLVRERELQTPYLPPQRLNTSVRASSLQPRKKQQQPMVMSYNDLLQRHSKRKTGNLRRRNPII